MDGHSGTVLGRVIALAVVASVLALVVGVVVSTTRPQRRHGSIATASAQLPLYYVAIEPAHGSSWYPADYAGYTDGIAIHKGASAPASCAAGSRCGDLVVMSKRACPTALAMSFDITQGLGGSTVGTTTAVAPSVAARQPVTLTYSYASDRSGLTAVISSVTCR